jgi:hypothetical protein
MGKTRYCINPNIIWVNEPHGQIKVLISAQKDPIYFSGVDAILWRSLWQDFPFGPWINLAQEEGKTIDEIIQRWIKLDLIKKVEK